MAPVNLTPWLAIMLAAAVAPVAVAERQPAYLVGVVVAGMGACIWHSARKRGLIGSGIAHLATIAAFAGTLLEYLVYDHILVVGLCHFLAAVCAVKLLQARTLRDDTLVVILSLLMLVVGAVISGDVVFAMGLVIVVALAIPTLVRLHLMREMASAGQRAGYGGAAGEGGQDAPAVASAACRRSHGVTLSVTLACFALGAAVFLVCPRVHGGLIRQLREPGVGMALTGFSPAGTLEEGTTITSSDQAVMRVRFSGNVPFSPEELENEVYLRGAVSERYGRRVGGLGGGWGWHRPAAGGEDVSMLGFQEDRLVLGVPEFPETAWSCEIYLEPGEYRNLFTPLPVTEIYSRELEEVRYNRRDTVFTPSRGNRLHRYTVTTVPTFAATRVHWQRPPLEDPPLIAPEAPLPRAEEIIRLIDEKVGATGPLNLASNREAFLGRLQEFLRSSEFTYSLSLPRLGPGREPVGEFLLDTHRGHCEYFATAMVVVCQMKGIPCRLVSGYRGGEYNPVGNGFLVVRERHAHAWVEAYVPGKGWVTCDPTPGAPRSGLTAASWLKPIQSYLDFMQFQWASLVVSYDATARQELFSDFWAWLARPARDETSLLGGTLAFVRELFGRRLDLSIRDRVLYWVFALLVTALVVLWGYILLVAGRWLAATVARMRQAARQGRGPRGEAEFYRRFCRRLEALGVTRVPGQTPAEFASDVAAEYPALTAAPDLVRLYYDVEFGRHSLAPAQRDWVEGVLHGLRSLERSDLRPEGRETHPR